MRLMLYFFRAHPWQTTVMLLALLFAGIAEGMGLSALLPLLNLAVRQDAADPATIENPFERQVVETLTGFGIEPTIGTLLVIIVLGVTLKTGLLLVAKKQIGYTAAQVATDLRLELLDAVMRSRWQYFLSKPVGALTNALASESARSADAFISGSTMITFLIQALIYGGVAVAVSWRAALIGLLVSAVVIGLLHFLVNMARRAGKKQTNLFISLISRLTDTLQSVKPLKAMGQEHLAGSVLRLETERVNKALRKQVFASASLHAGQEELLAIVVSIGIFILLVRLEMPLSTVMVLMVTLGRMLSHLGKVQKQYQKLASGESAFWSIRRSIDEARAAEEHLTQGLPPPRLERGIRLSGVRFAYSDRDAPLFDGLELDIPAGSLTTLVGPSGAGKTTIIDLVIGLLRPSEGAVLIDDTDLAQLDLKAWRRMIGYVPQENLLLHDSVLHNVTLGDPTLDEADAERALRQAGAWDFVRELPDGLLTDVGERGGRLSGGQRQRIMIARALVHRPRLLILDEATSALDPASEAAICRTIEELRGGLTILAISHQSALVKAADRVYRLRDGKAVPETPA